MECVAAGVGSVIHLHCLEQPQELSGKPEHWETCRPSISPPPVLVERRNLLDESLPVQAVLRCTQADIAADVKSQDIAPCCWEGNAAAAVSAA